MTAFTTGWCVNETIRRQTDEWIQKGACTGPHGNQHRLMTSVWLMSSVTGELVQSDNSVWHGLSVPYPTQQTKCILKPLQPHGAAKAAFKGRLLPSSPKRKDRATPIRADSTVMTHANEKGVGQMQMLKAQWAMRLNSALEPFISWHCSSWEHYFKELTPVSELLSTDFSFS